MRVVRIDLGIGDDAILADDVAGRHWQGPAVLAVELGQVGTELLVDVAQVAGHGPANTELRAHFAAGIAQNGETEAVLALGPAAIGGSLR